MPQGKIKVKTQMPSNVKGKKVKKLDKVPPKRKVQRKQITICIPRACVLKSVLSLILLCTCSVFLLVFFQLITDNPIGPRKVQIMEAKQMRKNISKTINQTLEDRLLSQVSNDGRPMSVIGRKAVDEAKAEKAKNRGKK